MSMINTTSKSLNARTIFIFQCMCSYEQFKFMLRLDKHKKVYNLGANLACVFADRIFHKQAPLSRVLAHCHLIDL